MSKNNSTQTTKSAIEEGKPLMKKSKARGDSITPR
jgi:hypothetical protein